MEDVIFGGAQDRRRQGFAQVTLTLEQCQDLLPDGGQEVAVTRRYYRSGESEYAINGTAVRLRDVNELFMDTGLGQEGYALIGQGKIDEILSAKSTQRREIFEEAAGISHCRHQKEETQRKLERTQENLLRIGDKLEELELQRTPLQAQAEQAQTYLALREELRVLEISLWMDQLDQQRAKSAALEKDLATARQELESCSVQADQLYAKGETLCSSCGTSRPRRKHYGPSSRTTKPSSGTTVSGWNFSGTGCGPMKPGPSGPRQTWRSSRAAGRPWRPTWPVSRPS